MNLTSPKVLEAPRQESEWIAAETNEAEYEVDSDRAHVGFAIVFLGTGALFVGGILALVF